MKVLSKRMLRLAREVTKYKTHLYLAAIRKPDKKEKGEEKWAGGTN